MQLFVKVVKVQLDVTQLCDQVQLNVTQLGLCVDSVLLAFPSSED